MTNRLNVLQITTHDSGRHFGCYGHPTVHTPAIDQLAGEGVRFTDYFCTVPICSASRASQLTGLYPQTHGLMDLVGYGWRLHPHVQHASQLFKAAGYRTLLWGVQHEVPDSELNRLAFDCAQPKPNHAAAVADQVTTFLRQDARTQQPFYAQIGFFETHTPYSRAGNLPDAEKGIELPPYLADTPSAREAMAAFQGSLRAADAAVGRILAALHETGFLQNTLVVMTTDHGVEMPRSKWNLYDPGIGIGLILRGPSVGMSGGRTWGHLMSNVDYLPTLLDLAGLECPSAVQGRSVLAALRAHHPTPVRDAVYGLYHKTQTRYVRTDRYKMIRHFDGAFDFQTVPVRFEDIQCRKVIGRVELFDLQNDPSEFKNCAGQPEYSDVQTDLESRLWTWMEAVQDPLLRGPVITPSYAAALRDYHSWRDSSKPFS